MSIIKPNIRVATRAIKSYWTMVRCVDGDLFVHIGLLEQMPNTDFSSMTMDAVSALVDKYEIPDRYKRLKHIKGNKDI